MIKRNFIMFALLILVLSLTGAVSAGDITGSDGEVQTLNQDISQSEIAVNSDLPTCANSHTVPDTKESSAEDITFCNGNDFSSYNLFEENNGNLQKNAGYEPEYCITASLNKSAGFESEEDVSVIGVADSIASIEDGTSHNALTAPKSSDKISDSSYPVKSTYDDLKQIGADAAYQALNYYKSHGINVRKDYENFYILTSAGYAKINDANTDKAIDGLLEVFGFKMNKNIDLIHIPMWKDLIFYFIWAKNNDFISYGLKYHPGLNKLIESEAVRHQGDRYIYHLELFFINDDNGYFPYSYLNGIDLSGGVNTSLLANDTNVNGNNTNASNATDVNLPETEMPAGDVNPYNLLYTLAAIFLVCAVFGVSYSKR